MCVTQIFFSRYGDCAFICFVDYISQKLSKFNEPSFLSRIRTFAVWEVRREDEFSPLKNESGAKDTAATCRRDLMLQHVRWLQQAGADLPKDIEKNM